MTTELTNEQIWERRFNVAIERFKDYDEYMEIPGYGVEPECPPTPILTEFQEYQNNLEKRFEACKQRYQGMEEYMEIPDMDLWLNLKNEIIPKIPKLERHVCQTFYTLKEMQDNMNYAGYNNYSLDNSIKDNCTIGDRFCEERFDSNDF